MTLAIVAELGASHMGSLHRAMEIIDAAHRAGATAIKLQTYTADTMVADRSYVIPHGPWAGRLLWELYQEAQTPWLWHKSIFDHCHRRGIECFSTPFSPHAVDFLEQLQCPRYKIASFEIVDIPLIRYAARTGKPLILSTGMASCDEIRLAVNAARNAGCEDLTLLKCTSAYPAPIHDANLATLAHMRYTFQCKIGLSDHTKGTGVAIAAVMLGANLIEKHITLADGAGLDGKFALKPDEFECLVMELESARQAMGGTHYGPTEAELPSLDLRRSLYAVSPLKKGQLATTHEVQTRRPAKGIDPVFIGSILGKRATQDIAAGTALTWEMFE